MAPRRPVVAGLLLLALMAASCGDFPDGPAAAHELNQPAPTTSAPSASPSPREFLEVAEGEATHGTPEFAQVAVTAPKSLARWEWAVRASGDRLTVYAGSREGTRRSSIDATNPWGQRVAFPIRGVKMRGETTWYRILLGIEPNGSTGWIKGDEVTFDRIRHRVVVDLSQRELRHYRNGKLRHRFTVGIGAPGTPTTTGRFFVWAHLDPRDASGPYGSYLLGLSGFSEVLTYWPGGGRMAIHGTADPSDRGRRVSYGCPRVFNPQMNKLRDIQMGTTVLIRP
jgi:lipoprotein-anchoring transpeptidase ErfK/SrfK